MTVFKNSNIDVIFYYPQHFNRGIGNSNQYFEPLVNTCIKNDLSYILVEEPIAFSSSKSMKNSLAKQFYWLYIILILRKILPLFFFTSFEARERFFGRIINIFSFGSYKAKNYITLSNSLGGVLRGINPEAKIFDYQHGIITSTQQGFFTKDRKAPDWIKSNNKEVLVYGKGFETIMKQTDPDYYEDKVFVIGQSSRKMQDFKIGSNILVSLQIIETENVTFEWLQTQVDLLDELFKEYSTQENCSTIYLRHHPRSTKSFNLEKLYKYDFAKDFDASPDSFKIGLHITFFSTSAFEFASLGIPTLFLYNDTIPQGKNLFFEEFKYPFPEIDSIEEWENKLIHDHNNDVVKIIKNWYQMFYQEYDENEFIRLLKI